MFANNLLFIIGILTTTASRHDSHEISENRNLNSRTDVNTDNSKDTSLLDDVQNSIGRVKTVINKHNIIRRYFGGRRSNIVRNFILNIIQTLNTFDDGDLQYFFIILNGEMKKYHYQGCTFNELTTNNNFRTFIRTKLKEFKYMPVILKRQKLLSLSNIIEGEDYDSDVRKLFLLINSLYKHGCSNKFKKVLSDLDNYSHKSYKDTNLIQIIKDAVRINIFDHYSLLNYDKRIELKSAIDEYWKDYNSNKTKHENLTYYHKTYEETKHNILRHIDETENVTTRWRPTKESTEAIAYSRSADNEPKRQRKTKSLYISGKKKTTDKKHRSTIVVDNSDEKYSMENIKTTKSSGYMYKQMYVEKNLDLKYDMNAYDNLTTNYNNEVTSEHSRTKKRNPRISHNAKNDGYTFKQMYVQENLDLNYDPYAYDKFTTNPSSEVTSKKKRKSKKRKYKTSHNTKTDGYSYTQMSIETSLELKHDMSAHNSLTTKASDEATSEQHIKTKKRNPKSSAKYNGYTYKQMYVEKNLDLKYDMNAYDNLTKETDDEVTSRSIMYTKPTTKRQNTKKRKSKKKSDRTTSRGFHSWRLRAEDTEEDETHTQKYRHRIRDYLPKNILMRSHDSNDENVERKKKINFRHAPEVLTPPYRTRKPDLLNTQYPIFPDIKTELGNTHGLFSMDLTGNETPKPHFHLHRKVTPEHIILIPTVDNGAESANKIKNHNSDEIVINSKNILNQIQKLESELNLVKLKIDKENIIIKDLRNKVAKQEEKGKLLHTGYNSDQSIRHHHSREAATVRHRPLPRISTIFDLEPTNIINEYKTEESNGMIIDLTTEASPKFRQRQHNIFGTLDEVRSMQEDNKYAFDNQLDRGDNINEEILNNGRKYNYKKGNIYNNETSQRYIENYGKYNVRRRKLDIKDQDEKMNSTRKFVGVTDTLEPISKEKEIKRNYTSVENKYESDPKYEKHIVISEDSPKRFNIVTPKQNQQNPNDSQQQNINKSNSINQSENNFYKELDIINADLFNKEKTVTQHQDNNLKLSTKIDITTKNTLPVFSINIARSTTKKLDKITSTPIDLIIKMISMSTSVNSLKLNDLKEKENLFDDEQIKMRSQTATPLSDVIIREIEKRNFGEENLKRQSSVEDLDTVINKTLALCVHKNDSDTTELHRRMYN